METFDNIIDAIRRTPLVLLNKVVPDGAAAVGLLRDRDVDAWVCGAVTDHPGVEVTGR